MIITAFNPDIPEQELTYLSLAVQPGTASITVKNNEEFALNDRILLGAMGTETAEIVSVTGAVTPGTALTIGPTIFGHNPDDPVTRLRYDQVKFYRSTTGTTGTYTLLTTVAMDVDNADSITVYDDTVGLATYFYKVSYYNSVSTLESTQSDAIPGSGYLRNTVGFLYDEFTRETSEQDNVLIDPTEFLGWMNEVGDEILLNARKPYRFLYTRTTVNVAANTQTVALPTDANGNQIIWKLDRIEVYYTNPVGSTPVVSPATNPTPPNGTVQRYPLRYIPPEEFDLRFMDQNFLTDDLTQLYTIDESSSLLRLAPPPTDAQTGFLYIWYWKKFTQLSTFGQAFETPTYQVYKKFALYRYFKKKAENDVTYQALWQDYKQDYTREIIKLTKFNQRQVGQPNGMEFGTDTSANTYDRVVQAHKGFRRF